MSRDRRPRTLGAFLLAVVMLTPAWMPGAWAASAKYKSLFRFKGEGGTQPSSVVTFDREGNLYGTTYSGGVYNCGTVFKLTPNGHGGWTERVLHSFKDDGNDGRNPLGGVIFDRQGNLYGTTWEGGSYFYGTVFKLTPNSDGSWTESLLHSFKQDGVDGTTLYDGVIFDGLGNLYGTTFEGGAYGHGTVFQLAPNGDGSWTENILHSFNHLDGGIPYAGLIFDNAGSLYGTTSEGGAYGFYGYGTVFKLTPTGQGGWTESVLHSFRGDGKDGDFPVGLILDSERNLYGTTYGGGANRDHGTIFKMQPTVKGGWKETVMHSFMGHPGAHPCCGVVFDAHGNLYGTTQGNGNQTVGSVFEITP